MVDYFPPESIISLFDTEELAESKGRIEFIKWFKDIGLQAGDRVWYPDPEVEEANGEGGCWVRKESAMA